MNKEKKVKYNKIFILLALLTGVVFIFISILIWPMTVLLLVFGIVLIVVGVIELIKFLRVA